MKKHCFMILVLTVLSVTADIAMASDDSEKNEWTMACKIYGDKRARRVGDLVTVLIEEVNSASKDAKNKSDNKSSISATASIGHPTIDARPTAWTNSTIPKWGLDASRTFEGGGSLENSDKFSSKLTARVTEVLPNGNLLIEGKRIIILQDESVEVILTGIVRPVDIAKDNTIQSSAIADAAIKYVSGGTIAKNQRKGILSRTWDWVNPF
jgi:flagellar L-ring protein FlgH